jgi:hypothetical protein
MGAGRLPGPLGQGGGVVLRAPVLGADPWEGHEPEQVGPAGTEDPSAAELLEGSMGTDEDRLELELLREVCGEGELAPDDDPIYGDASGSADLAYDVRAYIADRDEFFGAGYAEYKNACLKELEDDRGKLRQRLDAAAASRAQMPRWGNARGIIYCWIRKTLENTFEEDVGVRSGLLQSEARVLSEALAKLERRFTYRFKYGGLAPPDS